ncbi:hypothetical protein CEXT_103851 [Caerostris extrusa]|uniref:Uncharacterized protein n=1 Tax=Caerostris extrusa TaxID=172846 RepID=A0AAV4Q958_CAEEX|nr:hypothetical protein CEXT_103851 [Caerostris extrusa]
MHTAARLFAGSQSSTNCAFYNEKSHESKNCKLALNLDLQEKQLCWPRRNAVIDVSRLDTWAILNHLLDGAPDCYKMTAQHLQKSMYVDNCVASVKSEADLTKFYK